MKSHNNFDDCRTSSKCRADLKFVVDMDQTIWIKRYGSNDMDQTPPLERLPPGGILYFYRFRAEYIISQIDFDSY